MREWLSSLCSQRGFSDVAQSSDQRSYKGEPLSQVSLVCDNRPTPSQKVKLTVLLILNISKRSQPSSANGAKWLTRRSVHRGHCCHCGIGSVTRGSTVL